MGDQGAEKLPPSFLADPEQGLDAWSEIWRRGRQVELSSHRRLVGPLIVRLKKALRAIVRPSLADLFDLQRVFNAVVIHHLHRVEGASQARFQDAWDRLEQRTDHLVQRGDSLFVVLDKRLEVLDQQVEDLASGLERQAKRFLLELGRPLEERQEELARRLGELRQQQFVLTRRLDQLLARGPADPGRMGGEEGPAGREEREALRSRLDDHAYYLFENLFRGPEEVIRERQRAYLPCFRGRGRVLDIGCGRGEFLDLLRQEGVAAYGVDLNEDMIHVCREKGLEVEQEEALGHLGRVAAGSLGGVFLAQFIEHLPAPAIVELVKRAWSALEEGGALIMETQNPLSLVVSARNFYTDLSHVRPIHPQAARFLLQMVGFREVEVRFLSPFSPEEQLATLFEEGTVAGGAEAPLWEKVAANFRKVNDLLYGYQDFAVIGRK